MGLGGVNNRNAMQLIHAIYDLQIWVGMDDWRFLVQKASAKLGIPFVDLNGDETNFAQKMQAPVLTRWWTVGQAARLILKNLKIYREVVILCKEMERTGRDDAVARITCRLHSLLLEDALISDIHLINCFDTFYISKHFKWLQGGNRRIGNTPGFYGRNMLVRYFLMWSDLKQLVDSDGWREMPGMKDFYDTLKEGLARDGEIEDIKEILKEMQLVGNIATMNADVDTDKGGRKNKQKLRSKPRRPLNPNLQKIKARMFFSMALQQLEKHFTTYANERLFLGLFGETEAAKIVAKKILEPARLCATDIDKNASFHCTMQGRNVNLHKFAKFLDEKVDNTGAVSRCPHLQKFGIPRIRSIESGISIWNDQAPIQFQMIRKYYLSNYAAFLSSTHCVEAGVKKSKDSDNKFRSDIRESHYMIGSNLITVANRKAIKTMVKVKLAKGKQYKNKGKPKPRDTNIFPEVLHIMQALDQDVNQLRRKPEMDHLWKRIQKSLSSIDESFQKKRDQDRLKERVRRIEQRTNTLNVNQLADQEGFEEPDYLTGRVEFDNKLNPEKHKQLVIAEMQAREISITKPDSDKQLAFRSLVSKLRKHEISIRCNVSMDDFEKLSDQEKQAMRAKVKGFDPILSDVDDWHCGDEE